MRYTFSTDPRRFPLTTVLPSCKHSRAHYAPNQVYRQASKVCFGIAGIGDTLRHIPVLHEARADHSPDIGNDAESEVLGVSLEISQSERLVGRVAAEPGALEVECGGGEARFWGSNGQSAAVTGDFRGVVDEVGGNVGVFRLVDGLLEVQQIGKVGHGRELLTMGSVGFGAGGTPECLVLGARVSGRDNGAGGRQEDGHAD